MSFEAHVRYAKSRPDKNVICLFGDNNVYKELALEPGHEDDGVAKAIEKIKAKGYTGVVYSHFQNGTSIDGCDYVYYASYAVCDVVEYGTSYAHNVYSRAT